MLSDAIASLGAVTYVVRRLPVPFGGGIVTDGHGRVVPQARVPLSVVGMMQPLSGREIDRLPEGLHARELRALWTTDTLTVSDSDAQLMGDYVVTLDGIEWEVVRIEAWEQLAPYNRYVLSRVDP